MTARSADRIYKSLFLYVMGVEDTNKQPFPIC